VGDEHDKPADEEILGDDQCPDGSADRKGTNIAPEDPGRVVFEEEIGQQGAGSDYSSTDWTTCNLLRYTDRDPEPPVI